MSKTEPTYTSSTINEPIKLYSGLMTLHEDHHDAENGSGIVWLSWNRRPNIEFFMDPDTGSTEFLGSLELEELDEEIMGRVFVWGGSFTPHEPSPITNAMRGDLVEPFVHSKSEEIAYGQLHLINFSGFLNDHDSTFSIDDLEIDGPEIEGRQVAPQGATASTVMEADGWRVTIRILKGGGDLQWALGERSGFAITHFAVVERADGSPYSPDQFREIREALFWFFSFAMGYWCAPYLPVGFDCDGGKIWEEWSSEQIDNGIVPRPSERHVAPAMPNSTSVGIP